MRSGESHVARKRVGWPVVRMRAGRIRMPQGSTLGRDVLSDQGRIALALKMTMPRQSLDELRNRAPVGVRIVD